MLIFIRYYNQNSNLTPDSKFSHLHFLALNRLDNARNFIENNGFSLFFLIALLIVFADIKGFLTIFHSFYKLTIKNQLCQLFIEQIHEIFICFFIYCHFFNQIGVIFQSFIDSTLLLEIVKLLDGESAILA